MSDNPKLREIFNRASELPDDQRSSFLDVECAGNPIWRVEIESLLAALNDDEGFLDRPTNMRGGAGAPMHVALTGGDDVTRDAPAGSLGDQIGPYKLLERLGEGGMGIVYLAEQKTPVRRQVALKVIKLGMDTREVVARFEAERQALALMEHPNIAKVLEAGATDAGRPYFVMELVRGLPITEYADKHKLSTKGRVALASQICRAVQHAHSKGIIHRDLKPSNVLVTVIDDRPVPKVIDFGIAKATQNPLTDRTLHTAFRQLMGTPQYMSPEQADSDGSDIDTRSDVYSLGVLIYELLVGTTPLDARQLRSAAFEAMRKMICDADTPRPATRLQTLAADTRSSIAKSRSTDVRKLTDSIKGELDWIVMKALEKDRSRRYDTAAALADDLNRYLAGDAVLAGPVSGIYQLKKMMRRYRTAVVIGAAITACLLLGVAGTTWGLVQARHQRDRAESNARETLHQKNIATANEKIARDKQAEATATLDYITGLLAQASPKNTRNDSISKVLVDALIAPACKSIDKQFGDRPLVRASVQEMLGLTLLELGRAGLAEPQAKAAWDTRLKLLGDADPETLTALDNYASVVKALGRYAEAERLFSQAWSSCRRVLGDNHPQTLAALNNYANSINAQHRYAEAERLWKQVLDARRQVSGDKDPNTLAALDNYAQAIDAQGHHADAEQLAKQAWDARRTVLGDDHPDTLTSLANYARTVDEQGRHADAERLSKQVWDARRRVQGDDHPETLTAINNYAKTISSQGRHADAEVLLKQALEARQRVQGNEHPVTLMALENYADLIKVEGRYADAEPLFKLLWEARQRVLGEDDPDTLKALNKYANMASARRDYPEAEQLFKQLWDSRRRSLGDDHPDTLMTLANYAKALNAQGNHTDAEPLLKQSWDGLRRILGEDTPDTLSALNNYAVALESRGAFPQAEQLLKRALDIRQKAGEADDDDMLATTTNYAFSIDYQGRHADAEPLFELVWEARKRKLGDDHPDTIDALNKYVRVAAALAHWEAIEPPLRQVADYFRKSAPEDPGRGSALFRLGQVLAVQQKWSDAEVVLRENWTWDKNHPAPDRIPGTMPGSLRLLNQCLKAQGKPTEPTTATTTKP